MIIAELKIKDIELADGRTSNDVSEEWIETVVDFGGFMKGDIVQHLGHNCSDADYEKAGLSFIEGKGWVIEGKEITAVGCLTEHVYADGETEVVGFSERSYREGDLRGYVKTQYTRDYDVYEKHQHEKTIIVPIENQLS